MRFRLIDAESNKVLAVIDTPTLINDSFPERCPAQLTPYGAEFWSEDEKAKLFLVKSKPDEDGE